MHGFKYQSISLAKPSKYLSFLKICFRSRKLHIKGSKTALTTIELGPDPVEEKI